MKKSGKDSWVKLLGTSFEEMPLEKLSKNPFVYFATSRPPGMLIHGCHANLWCLEETRGVEERERKTTHFNIEDRSNKIAAFT